MSDDERLISVENINQLREIQNNFDFTNNDNLVYFYNSSFVLLERLKDWIEVILDENDPSQENVKRLTGMVKELRETMNIMLTIDKTIKSDSLSEAAMWKAKYNELTQIVLSNLCPDCRKAISVKI